LDAAECIKDGFMVVKKKLLIVDDEPDILEFLKKRLIRHGYDVFVASCGKECLEMLSTVEPDLIILDIVMPFMDGYEVLKKISGNHQTRHIPIVMHSVKKESRSIFRSQDLGSIDYVIKPVSFEKLLKVIKRYA